MSSYTPDYDPNEEDRRYDEDRQRRLDEQAELREAQRRASGISAEQLSLLDAFQCGQRAGSMGHGASMNPYQSGSPEHAEWERARMATIAARLTTPRRAA